MAISDMPVIGRHTKLGHGHLLSIRKAPEGPDTLEISHELSFHTERPRKPNRIRITHLLSTIFKIPKSQVNVELRIVVRNIVRSPEKDFQ